MKYLQYTGLYTEVKDELQKPKTLVMFSGGGGRERGGGGKKQWFLGVHRCFK